MRHSFAFPSRTPWGTSAAAPFALVALATVLAAAPARAQDETKPAPAEGAPAEGSTEAPAKPATKPAAEASTESSMTDVEEKPGERYFFVGARYRLDVIPKFLVNAFASQGGTFLSHAGGVEAEIRKDGFSIIPALSYESFGTGGNVLFLQKGQDPTNQGNWSEINSSLGAIFATVDLLWSVKIHPNIEFEYGGGVGLGVVTGSLVDNWVYADAAGPLKANPSQGGFTAFSPCQTTNDGMPSAMSLSGCDPGSHKSPNPNKVGGYKEPSIFNSGARPPVLPWLSLPQFGLRIKPIKQLTARVQLGLALTGFWFGISADYGLEKPEKK